MINDKLFESQVLSWQRSTLKRIPKLIRLILWICA